MDSYFLTNNVDLVTFIPQLNGDGLYETVYVEVMCIATQKIIHTWFHTNAEVREVYFNYRTKGYEIT